MHKITPAIGWSHVCANTIGTINSVNQSHACLQSCNIVSANRNLDNTCPKINRRSPSIWDLGSKYTHHSEWNRAGSRVSNAMARMVNQLSPEPSSCTVISERKRLRSHLLFWGDFSRWITSKHAIPPPSVFCRRRVRCCSRGAFHLSSRGVFFTPSAHCLAPKNFRQFALR